ncbi:MAG: hypothetical protein KDE50_01330 [Caldilineaceae bacterium]|nr:hypothetical protein [Nitrospira sp.]MCB0094353.1 hypothetical protein [Caldilineaceae bacterium]MCB0138526.1 hypothetical protein [Caldilineaceae bacterium]
MGIFFLIAGLIGLLAPRLAWYLGEGWKLKDVEPSDLLLITTRIGGLIAIVIGIAMLGNGA